MDKQIKQLRQQAHKLHPVVIIGNKALTESVHAEIETALIAHELIKIRVNAADAEERQTMIEAICEQHNAQLVQKIGHVISLYRENTDDATSPE